MVILPATIAKGLVPGVRRFFGHLMDKHESVYQFMYDRETSMRKYEEYVQLVGLGLMSEKDTADNVNFDDIKQSFTTRLTAITYGLGITINKEAFDDDQYKNLLQVRTKGLQRAVAATYDHLAAAPYNNAFDSSYAGGDGVALASTAHPYSSGTTWSNRLAVDADFSEASLEQAYIEIGDWVDARGIPMAAKVERIIYPNELRFDVARVLQSDKTPGSSNNAKNVVAQDRIASTLCYQLDTADNWFLRTNIPGMRFIDREQPNFDVDPHKQSRNMHFMVFMRAVFGWDDPHNLFCVNGA